MSNYDVFISYSRKDDADQFVTRMKVALEAAGLRVWMDDKIVSSAEWWAQIETHIERSHNFLLFISEHSLASEWCQKEIAHAFDNGKRLIAFQLSAIDEKRVKGSWMDTGWEQIARANWEPLRKVQWITDHLGVPDFDAAVARIKDDAQTDPAYVEAHTRLLLQAQTWLNSGESPGAHISGEPLAKAEMWLAAWDGKTLPAPTDLQRAFVSACRTAQDAQEAFVRDLETRAQQAQAELTSVQAKIAEGEGRITSLDLASHAVEILNNGGNPELAALLGIRALKARYTRQADYVLQDAIEHLYCQALLRGHDNVVNTVLYSPDGRYILSAGDDGTVRRWDTHSNMLAEVLCSLKARLTCLAYSPDGSSIATGTHNGMVYLLEAATGAEISIIYTLLDESVNSVAYSPDGRFIVTTCETNVAVWEVSTGAKIQTFNGHENIVWSAVYKPTGDYILTASEDTTVRVWKVATGREVHTIHGYSRHGHRSTVWNAVYSPTGRSFVTASLDDTVRIWDSNSYEQVEVIEGHGAGINTVLFSPDEQSIVSACDDFVARIWNTTNGAEVRSLFGHQDNVRAATFSRDVETIATASADGTVRIWRGLGTTRERILSGHRGDVISASFSPDGRFIVTASSDKTAKIWDSVTCQEIHTLKGHKNWVTSAQYSTDGRFILTGSWDGTVCIWSANSGKQVKVLSAEQETVNSAVFSPDGQFILIATGSWLGNDCTVQICEYEKDMKFIVLQSQTKAASNAVYVFRANRTREG